MTLQRVTLQCTIRHTMESHSCSDFALRCVNASILPTDHEQNALMVRVSRDLFKFGSNILDLHLFRDNWKMARERNRMATYQSQNGLLFTPLYYRQAITCALVKVRMDFTSVFKILLMLTFQNSKNNKQLASLISFETCD